MPLEAQRLARGLLNAGVAYSKLGELDVAHDALQRCLASQPDFAEAGRVLTAIVLERRRTDEALD
jgi:hypothetical protein